MRLRIRHETAYAYETPALSAIQILRLTPRGHNGQFVIDWRVEVDRDCKLDTATDPFGNTVHSFTVDGPLDGLTIIAEGEIETSDTDGVVSGQPEPMPPAVFLRETRLTTADAAIRALATESAAEGGTDVVAVLHGIMNRIRAGMRFEINATDVGTSAVDAFREGHGVCQDFSHVFIAAARHLGIPARYTGGYLFRHDGEHDQEAGHAWAEALVPALGWVGFDPANGISATDAYVRAAVGLDYLGAAPVRGTRYGGGGESLSVRILTDDVAHRAR
jgi:transglutaminase-like putative cysteine protease